MRTMILYIIFITLLSSLPKPYQAVEDSLNVRRVYEIEGVRVVGESMAKKIGTVDIRTRDSETINTEIAIGSMIKELPGVFLTEKGKGESIVRFRGFQDRHIRVFIDGMPISDGYFGNYDLHLLSANNVSAIHLIKGPVSHQYGFNTLGGILNIVTDNLQEENRLQSQIQFSSHGNWQKSLNGSYGLGRSQLYLNASYLHSPGFVLPENLEPLSEGLLEEGGGRRINSERDQYTINMRLITDIAGMHTFSITSGYSFMPHKGNPPSIYVDTDSFYSSLKNWGKLNASIAARSRPTDDLDVKSSVYYDRSEDVYIRYRDHTYETADWQSLIRTNTLGFQTNVNYIYKGITDNDLGLRMEKKGYERTGGPGYADKWADNHLSLAKFYNNLLFPKNNDQFSLIIGNALSTYTHTKIESYRWYWEPQAAINYKARRANLSLAYGRSKQIPTMRQLFSSTSGNPGLKPEKAHKIEVSSSVPFSSEQVAGAISTSLYYNSIADLISRDRFVYYNLERLSTFGGELNIDFSLLDRLNHSYELSYIKLDKGNSSLALMEYPEIMLRLHHQLRHHENLFFSLTNNWYDESLTYYSSADYFNLPSYWTHDFGVKYLFNRSNITLNITNLLDTYHEPQYGYPAPGRDIILAFEVQLF